MYDSLYRWYEINQQLKELKAQELALRNEVAQAFFPELESGADRVDVPGDAVLECNRPLSYKLDEAALQAALEHVPKTKRDKLVRWKPSLDKRTYDSLAAKAKKGFDEAVICTVGTPALTLKLPQIEEQ